MEAQVTNHALIVVPDRSGVMTLSGAERIVNWAIAPPPDWGLSFWFLGGVGPVDAVRNMIAERFVSHPCATHLIMLGSDNTFDQSANFLFEEPERDIVGGAYLTWKGDQEGKQLSIVGAPLSGEWGEGPYHPARYVGMDCTRIRREVFGKIVQPYFRTLYMGAHGQVSHTEDVLFCQAAREAGFGVWIDERINCGHFKAINLDEVQDYVRARLTEKGAL